jgi:hypothetical protein
MKTARSGHTVTIRGSLQFKDGAWQHLPNRTLVAYFRAKGSSRWVKVRVGKTDSHGRFSFALHATKSGTWRVTFPGDTLHAAVTTGGVYVHIS